MEAIRSQLLRWAGMGATSACGNGSSIKCVLLDSASEKSFCSGGGCLTWHNLSCYNNKHACQPAWLRATHGLLVPWLHAPGSPESCQLLHQGCLISLHSRQTVCCCYPGVMADTPLVP